MTGTNVDIDEELAAAAMWKYNLRTKVNSLNLDSVSTSGLLTGVFVAVPPGGWMKPLCPGAEENTMSSCTGTT